MALEIERIKGLCFDVDGTLSDTDDHWVHRLEKFLLPLRWMLPKRDVQSFARFWLMALETPGNLLYHLADRLGIDDNIGYLMNWVMRSNHRRAGHFWMVPGVDQCLAALAERYPMTIVSARGEKSTLSFLEQFNLTHYFCAIATSQTCEFTKPFPDPVLWAARQMQLPPENCLMIGDTTVDIKAGKRAGAQTLGVLCGFGQEKELSRAGADHILTSTACLHEHLAGE